MGAPTAGAAVRLALDHHYSPAIARQLRDLGHDVIAASDAGWERHDDATLLQLCAEQQRALLTDNVADFVVLARRWSIEGRGHLGLIFTSDASMPRSRRTIGRYVQALGELLDQRPDDDALRNQIQWL
jgi:predicted nuclease of predicted toxin-antitoxin system